MYVIGSRIASFHVCVHISFNVNVCNEIVVNDPGARLLIIDRVA